MRLDKFLAEMSVGTRSEVKKYIKKGMVTVDGTVVKAPEYSVRPEENRIAYKEQPIQYTAYEYYMLYKPAGYVSATRDREHRVVLDLITDKKRKDLFPVGRLDKDTEGLLLITNDGVLAKRLLTPGRHVPKLYYARVSGKVLPEDIELFAGGIDIGESQKTKPAGLKVLTYDAGRDFSEVQVEIVEGKYHQIKRMFAKTNKRVLYLKRLSMGGLLLDERLAPGEYRALTKEELRLLRREAGEAEAF